MAGDGWQATDSVYRNRLRGLAVSAVYKVAGKFSYSVVAGLLAAKLVATVMAHPCLVRLYYPPLVTVTSLLARPSYV